MRNRSIPNNGRGGWRGGLAGITVVTVMLAVRPTPAQAETMKECSVKYHDAKQAGTLNGADWKSFRATQCAGKPGAMAAKDTDAAPPAGATAANAGTPAATPAPSPSPATPAARDGAQTAPGKGASGKGAPAPEPVASGNLVFPSRIDPKYASLKAGKGRMKTCDEQYTANKANGGNGGLKWIQKGGGYFSQCNRKLKAA